MPTKEQVLEALKDVKDPEIPQVDIVNLGLVYDVRFSPARGVVGSGRHGRDQDDSRQGVVVVVDMTFTSMGCPAGAAFEEMVKSTVLTFPEVRDVAVNVVWDPPWHPRMATEEGKLILESMGVRVDP